jgi:hypothetical protein
VVEVHAREGELMPGEISRSYPGRSDGKPLLPPWVDPQTVKWPAPKPKERPIIFSGDMVRALLAGNKTQTRRVVDQKRNPHTEPIRVWCASGAKPGEGDTAASGLWFALGGDTGNRQQAGWYPCPYGKPGDRLWVREAFAVDVAGCPGGVSYRADHMDPKGDGPAHPMKWKPSIHMPRKLSRITLEIVSVRVERLKAISSEDARAEGMHVEKLDSWGNSSMWWSWRYPHPGKVDECRLTEVFAFANLWNRIHGINEFDMEPWELNPWVWVLEFKVLE